jgi:hypothetical protein
LAAAVPIVQNGVACVPGPELEHVTWLLTYQVVGVAAIAAVADNPTRPHPATAATA